MGPRHLVAEMMFTEAWWDLSRISFNGAAATGSRKVFRYCAGSHVWGSGRTGSCVGSSRGILASGGRLGAAVITGGEGSSAISIALVVSVVFVVLAMVLLRSRMVIALYIMGGLIAQPLQTSHGSELTQMILWGIVD